mmetsp:Transcript_7943/g.19483  ORF Transcript_7943/g.19483 Transcript_7943/m.19483 type:complete len:557 (+) Transcript_7943:200-1870(+)
MWPSNPDLQFKRKTMLLSALMVVMYSTLVHTLKDTAGFLGQTLAHSSCVVKMQPSAYRANRGQRIRASLPTLALHRQGGGRFRGRNSRCKAEAESSRPEEENVVIIGSGPAGFTAAIYAARANLRPLVFEGFRMGGSPGGQLMTTTEVENFPGFPEGITGPALMDRMRAQAKRWGSEMLTEDVTNVDLSTRPFVVKSEERTVRANTIILATGATAKRLGIPKEEEFWSRGISACAICDGASPIFKNKQVAVVGGGDTALEEAVYLTKYASHVHVLVRSGKMRASKAMQDRVLNHDSISVYFDTEVVDAIKGGNGQLSGLELRNTKNNELKKLSVRGLFYGIGHQPNSDIVKGQVELDEAGYVKIFESSMTNVEGVFAAGDLHDTEWRQAITAAGSGCQAAIAAERYLVEKNLLREYRTTGTDSNATTGETEETLIPDDAETFDISETKHRGQYALRRLYHESDRVLAVLYTSPTCGPCRSLKPILGKLVDEFSDRMHYVEIDIVKDPDVAEAAGVTGTPTVQFFKDKSMLKIVSGVKMKSEYRQVVQKALEDQVPI